jgi:hypothetical protein
LQQVSDTTQEAISDRLRCWFVITCIESVTGNWLLSRFAVGSRTPIDFRIGLNVEADAWLSHAFGAFSDQRVQVLVQNGGRPMCCPGLTFSYPVGVPTAKRAVKSGRPIQRYLAGHLRHDA